MSGIPNAESPDNGEVLIDRRGPVTVLTLNRPERLNAMSHGLIRRLDSILDDLMYDYSQRVVVLTGAGRGFCAGTDLKGQAAGDRWVRDVGEVQSIFALQEAVGRLVVKLRQIPQPIIASVHGVAAGGGLSLACASDIRIAEPQARFDPAFVRLGVSGGDQGSSWFLPRIVGFERAAELLLTGRTVDAQTALEIGLVSRLVSTGEALETAVKLAEEMCRVAPFTTRMTKSLLNLSRDGIPLQQMIEVENRTQTLMTRTEDFREGVRAFAERRPPEFRDR